MKIVKKLAAFLILIAGLFVLASCGNRSGVSATMTYIATTSKIKITATFKENDKLRNGDATPSIKEYSVDEKGEKSFKETKTLTFSSGAYTTSSIEFSGLEKSANYYYVLYVKYNSKDEEIATLEAKTASEGDSDDTAIEITTVAQFNAIGDDVSAHYILKNDLDFENKDVNTTLSSSTGQRFTGVFDGGGHTIKNYTLPNKADIGLFNYTDGATIKNLNIDTVVADFGSENKNKSSSRIGALIGQAENTIVSNVSVNNVNISLNCGSSAEISVGGVIGFGTSCSFDSVSSSAVLIDFTSTRKNINAGLFAGCIKEKGAVTKTIEGEEDVYYVADKCSASGTINAALNYSTTEGYTNLGGFVGDLSSLSAVHDSYSDANIFVTKKHTATNTKFYLRVGGFVGYSNTINKIIKSLAYANIQVYAAAKAPTSTNGNAKVISQYDSSTSLDDYKNVVNAALIDEYNTFKSDDYDTDDYSSITTLKNNATSTIDSATDGATVYSTYNTAIQEMNAVLKKCDKNNITSSDSKTYRSCIGGFVGEVKLNSKITDCIYKEKTASDKTGILVRAKETISVTKDSVTTDEKVLFVSNTIGKDSGEGTGISNLNVWTSGMDVSAFGENVKAFLNK